MNARLYALIGLGNATLTGVLSGWLLYFYLPPGEPALVPLALAGVVMLAGRVVYVLASLPFETASRGRRLAWMLGGALGMPLLFLLLWNPPQPGDAGANLWFLPLVLGAYSLASAAQQIPYEALLPELANGASAQNTLSNWRMACLLGGNLLAGLAGPLIVALGYARAMGVFAAIGGSALLLPGLALAWRMKSPAGPAAEERVPWSAQIRAAWSRPGFRVFAWSWGLMWLATTFTFETLPYITTEICAGSKTDVAYLYFIALGAGLVAYPIVMRLAGRYGAERVFRGSLLAGALVSPGLVWIGTSIPIPLLAQGVLWIAVFSLCLSGAQTLPGAIARMTGVGEQAGFGNLIDQLASGVALAIIPLCMLLGRSQADALGPFGIRLLGLAGAGFLFAAFLVFGRFSGEKHPDLS